MNTYKQIVISDIGISMHVHRTVNIFIDVYIERPAA